MFIQKLKKYLEPQVMLEISANSGVMIDNLPCTFIVNSCGKESSQGLCVAFSGEEITAGNLKLEKLALHTMTNGKVKIRQEKLSLVTKLDGKKIYQAKFKNLYIPKGAKNLSKKQKGQALVNGMYNEMQFSVVPKYKMNSETEILITVYPYENILAGAATEYKTVTANQNYFADNLKNHS